MTMWHYDGHLEINKMPVTDTERSIGDIYSKIGDRARRRMCLALLLLFIHNIETHQLNHTDLEPRYQGDGPFAPTWEIFARDKIVTLLVGTTRVLILSTTSTTASPERRARDSSERSSCAGTVYIYLPIFCLYFASCCRCTNQKMCVSPGKYYDAFCQIEIMGVVWIQPKIIE